MNEYEEQAKDFLGRYGLAVSITRLDNKPPPWEEKPPCRHWRYRVKVRRKANNKTLSFYFWDSEYNYIKNKRPTAYDILATLSLPSYEYGDFNDFCEEFGYSDDSIKAFKTWRAINRFARRIQKFFTANELEELRLMH